MTTATNNLYAARESRPVGAPSALLAIVSFLLGMNMREALAVANTEQSDAGVTWGL